MLTHAAIILTLACEGLLISDRCHVRFATLVEKNRGVRDDIKYTCAKLKIVRLGIARTHGWVELAPMVPTSSSHRSSTVGFNVHAHSSFISLVWSLLLKDTLLRTYLSICYLGNLLKVTW